MKNAFKLFVLAVMAVSLMATGCKRKPKAGQGVTGGIDNIGGIVGSDLAGEGLGLRPENFTEIESQFGVVYFDYDSAQIRSGERPKIEAVADYLKRNPAVGVIVEGHCDERGSNEYNLALGERRAMAVRQYLITLGIDGARIQTKSYGEERPVALGHDESAWSQNRRAEFKLFRAN